MLLDVPLEAVIAAIGHDGSEIIRPDEPEPLCRRGFHIDEFQDVVRSRSQWLCGITANPYHDEELQHCVWSPEKAESRLKRYMHQQRGLVVGMTALGKSYFHMVAWDGAKVYDPRGEIYDPFTEGGIMISGFYALVESADRHLESNHVSK